MACSQHKERAAKTRIISLVISAVHYLFPTFKHDGLAATCAPPQRMQVREEVVLAACNTLGVEKKYEACVKAAESGIGAARIGTHASYLHSS